MSSVLDHGEVLLVDHMAGDSKVVDAARISTGKEDMGRIRGIDAPRVVEKDRKLINYLMSNGHGTPFEHAVFQFYIKCPIFVAREWQRHRVASYNEFSMRYAEVKNESADFYIPSNVRVPDPDNKQSSVAVETDTVRRRELEFIESSSRASFSMYTELLARGVAREMARMVLPVNIYTKFWFTVNARSLMNFLMLRNHPAAQWEIHQYAGILEWEFAQVMPWTHTAFVENGRKAP